LLSDWGKVSQFFVVYTKICNRAPKFCNGASRDSAPPDLNSLNDALSRLLVSLAYQERDLLSGEREINPKKYG
jgi:hypothetical protein